MSALASRRFTAPLIAVATIVITLRPAAAQTNRTSGRGSFGVVLQPFSAVTPARHAEAVQVAYYTPRARASEPVKAEPVTDDAEDEAVPHVSTRGSQPMVQGNYAVLQNGIAYAPSRAPANIKNAIWAVNNLRRKPYVWGGGHRSFDDYGYDCSGTVSYALHHAGLLAAPLPSSDLMRYGDRGRGRWITIYSRRGHTFAVIAGLRLDTTDFRYGGDIGPRWYVTGRSTRGFEARHPVGM